MKSTAPFASSTTQVPILGRQQVDADERAVDRPRGGERDRRRRPPGGCTGSRLAPSATFVRHSPAAATRFTAPTTWSPATTSRRS